MIEERIEGRFDGSSDTVTYMYTSSIYTKEALRCSQRGNANLSQQAQPGRGKKVGRAALTGVGKDAVRAKQGDG